LGRQDTAAGVRREGIGLSAAEASGGTQRVSERLAPCGRDTFTYVKHLSCLEMES